MKKILFCCALCAMIAGGLRAQEQPAGTPVPQYIYCSLVEKGAKGFTQTAVAVDFGQQTGLFPDQRLRDDEGNIVGFNPMIDAMNFMAADGWEFVQAYVTVAGGNNAAIVSNTYWVLRLDTGRLSPEQKEQVLQKLNTSKNKK